MGTVLLMSWVGLLLKQNVKCGNGKHNSFLNVRNAECGTRNTCLPVRNADAEYGIYRGEKYSTCVTTIWNAELFFDHIECGSGMRNSKKPVCGIPPSPAMCMFLWSTIISIGTTWKQNRILECLHQMQTRISKLKFFLSFFSFSFFIIFNHQEDKRGLLLYIYKY